MALHGSPSGAGSSAIAPSAAEPHGEGVLAAPAVSAPPGAKSMPPAAAAGAARSEPPAASGAHAHVAVGPAPPASAAETASIAEAPLPRRAPVKREATLEGREPSKAAPAPRARKTSERGAAADFAAKPKIDLGI
jgi:hypothetical protein